jgi:hypothetical protein
MPCQSAKITKEKFFFDNHSVYSSTGTKEKVYQKQSTSEKKYLENKGELIEME